MTFVDSIPIAKQLAENSLNKGFDVEAFLVLCALENMDTDLIPESNVDEELSDISVLFSHFFKSPTDSNLNILLDEMQKMLSEMYQSIPNIEQQTRFKKFLNNLNNIIK